MEDKTKQYDVAISFLSKDESLAKEISNRLEPLFNVFIFSKKQEELAGTDGLESLRQVFLDYSKLVVVLFRDGWGETPWTRVEQAAITDRFLKQGWDWLLFVSLDRKCTYPKWLPDSKIRLSLPDYGMDECIGAIKYRAVEVGAIARTISPQEQAQQVHDHLKYQEERKSYFTSDVGVSTAANEAYRLLDLIVYNFEEIGKSTPGLGLEWFKKDFNLWCRSHRAGLTIQWRRKYGNVLEGSRLFVMYFPYQVIFPGENKIYFERPNTSFERSYDPDLFKSMEPCWRYSGKSISSEELVEQVVRSFLEHIKSL